MYNKSCAARRTALTACARRDNKILNGVPQFTTRSFYNFVILCRFRLVAGSLLHGALVVIGAGVKKNETWLLVRLLDQTRVAAWQPFTWRWRGTLSSAVHLPPVSAHSANHTAPSSLPPSLLGVTTTARTALPSFQLYHRAITVTPYIAFLSLPTTPTRPLPSPPFVLDAHFHAWPPHSSLVPPLPASRGSPAPLSATRTSSPRP